MCNSNRFLQTIAMCVSLSRFSGGEINDCLSKEQVGKYKILNEISV